MPNRTPLLQFLNSKNLRNKFKKSGGVLKRNQKCEPGVAYPGKLSKTALVFALSVGGLFLLFCAFRSRETNPLLPG